MSELLLVCGIATSTMFFLASGRRGGGLVRNTIFHYYSLSGLIILLYQLDFYKLSQEGHSFVAFQNGALSEGGIATANTLFLAANILFLFISFVRPPRVSDGNFASGEVAPWSVSASRRERAAAKTFLVFSFVLWFVFIAIVASSIGSLNFSNFTTRRFIIFSENKILHYLAFWIPPAFTFAAAAIGPKSRLVLLLFVLSTVAMLLTGSRDRVVWVCIAYAASQSSVLKLYNRYLIVLVPALIIFLYGYLAIFRPHQAYDLTSILSPTGMYDYLVTSTEVTVPDNLSSIEEGYAPDRPPFSSILNIITYPIPRGMLGGLKTYGAAVDFTLEIRPEAWLLGRSATTISGFGELRLEFWYFYPIISAIFLSLLCRKLERWSFEAGYLGLAKYVLGYWILFHFYRTGLSELGNFIWLSAGSYFANLFLSRIKVSSTVNGRRK